MGDGERVLRGRGDTGAALVEGALIAPVFFLFLFAIFEFGLVFRDNLALANATTASSRTASTFGDDIDADAEIIQAIKQGSSAFPQDAIERVVIFNATVAAASQGVEPTQASVPTACLSDPVGVEGLCNVYFPDPHFTYTDPRDFNDDTQAGCVDNDNPGEYWCPMTRKNALNDPPDYLGVYIQIKHDYVTQVFGDSVHMENTKIVRLEPKTLN